MWRGMQVKKIIYTDNNSGVLICADKNLYSFMKTDKYHCLIMYTPELYHINKNELWMLSADLNHTLIKEFEIQKIKNTTPYLKYLI